VVVPSGGEATAPGPEAPILVIAATLGELEPLLDQVAPSGCPATVWGGATALTIGREAVVAQALGLGKANTAAGLMAALLAWRPRAVLQVGIGGAYLGSFLSVGMAAVATEEVDLELGVRTAEGWQGLAALGFPLTPASGGRPERANVVPTHPGLTAALGRVADLAPVRFATRDTVTGDVDDGAALATTHDVSIESMEGVAAAQVCDRLGVPFAEVRGVSNVVGQRDPARWNVRSAAHAACAAARALLLRWRDLDEVSSLDAGRHR
jgi:futalosine hydrolase